MLRNEEYHALKPAKPWDQAWRKLAHLQNNLTSSLNFHIVLLRERRRSLPMAYEH
jgi:hypothetical protein